MSYFVPNTFNGPKFQIISCGKIDQFGYYVYFKALPIKISLNYSFCFCRLKHRLLQVEQEYWKYVVLRENHICVHSGSIDCGNWGYGFPVTKNSPFAKHPWNLKMLTNNTGSILRSLGPLMGKRFSPLTYYKNI